ncbi:MAG: hypothetical protein SNJ75_06570 [Gemmataceae bacterium]
MPEKHVFHLSVEEAEYLRCLAPQHETLARLLKLDQEAHGRPAIIRLSPAEAEELRDSLTTQLAAVGFDENYSPNEQGRMLEKLIDKLFIPNEP